MGKLTFSFFDIEKNITLTYLFISIKEGLIILRFVVMITGIVISATRWFRTLLKLETDTVIVVHTWIWWNVIKTDKIADYFSKSIPIVKCQILNLLEMDFVMEAYILLKNAIGTAKTVMAATSRISAKLAMVFAMEETLSQKIVQSMEATVMYASTRQGPTLIISEMDIVMFI